MDQPIPLPVHLHRAVHEFVRASGRTRALPAVLRLGQPGAEQVAVPEQPWYDAAARADLVTRALDGLDDQAPLAWLTRQGSLEATDVDLLWCAAALTGFGRHGVVLPGFFVVTRRGWVNLTTGERQEWSRVRPNRQVG